MPTSVWMTSASLPGECATFFVWLKEACTRPVMRVVFRYGKVMRVRRWNTRFLCDSCHSPVSKVQKQLSKMERAKITFKNKPFSCFYLTSPPPEQLVHALCLSGLLGFFTVFDFVSFLSLCCLFLQTQAVSDGGKCDFWCWSLFVRFLSFFFPGDWHV